jgi:pyocin large subunit-like protein
LSIQALAWAFKQEIRPAALKFVLVALADCANEREDMSLWPSIAHICEVTCLDIKTVKQYIAKLKDQKLLLDTGERVGRTKQIKVYKLNFQKESRNGPVKEAQIAPETGPKTDYVKRPKNGPRNPYYRTLKEPQDNFYNKNKKQAPNYEGLVSLEDSRTSVRLNSFRKTGLWREEWGPKPNEA